MRRTGSAANCCMWTEFDRTMEAVEDAGLQFKQSLWRPVQKASALVQGIKIGLDLCGRERPRAGTVGGAGRGVVY